MSQNTMMLTGLCAVFCVALVVDASAAKANPVGQVIDMLTGLEQKILKEGEREQKTFEEFEQYCGETSRDLQYQIKTAKSNAATLEATIAKAKSDISEASEKIDELAGTVADSEAQLKAATKLRNQEHTDFKASEAELMKAKDTLERAIAIISREMGASGSFVQLKGTQGVLQALSVMVQASSVSTADASTLTSLLQSSTNSDSDDEDQDGDDAPGAPGATVYESHSGTVVETMNSLLDKTDVQLSELRQDETKAAHAYELAKQSLEDKIKSATEDMADAKKDLAAAGETKATAEGDLTVTKKDLKQDIESLEDLHHDCVEKAQDFQAKTSSRGEELKALAEAKKVIKEKTGGAEKQQYGLADISFMQVKSKATSSQGSEAVHLVRKLARTHHSGALMQLASRMEVAIRSEARNINSDDPFAKVKGLISDMIDKIQAEMSAAATQKAFCDKELAFNNEQKENKQDEIAKLTAGIDVATARSKVLKGEVVALQKELAAIAKRKAELTKIRLEEKAQYEANKPEMEEGLEGVKVALKILREYYGQDDIAHDAAEGAASGIISLLEVCESDFQKTLTEMNASEQSAVEAYRKEIDEIEVTVGVKDVDIKYKTKEYTTLDKNIADATSDREGVSSELDAVLKYLSELMKQCIAKPETYEERSKRRQDEIAGLKEALEILESETSLIQVGRVARHTLRGAMMQVSD